MKNFKHLVLTILTFCFALSLNAQDKDSPWAIGVGVNAVDVANESFPIKDYIGLSDWNTLPILTRAYVARYLGKGFTADFAGSFNAVTKILGNQDANSRNYYSLDLGARYDLNSLFGETGIFDPYLKASFGQSWIEDDQIFSINPSAGFNIWFHETLGLNFESNYKIAPDLGIDGLETAAYIGRHHFQHSISLVWRFGKKDADKDGISDKDDLCPDVFGLKAFAGCPDSDGDGIEDSKDACPNIAGTKGTQGCPDADGDGVKDTDDLCPSVAGEFNGCPDTDGDGLADNYDACPEVSGDKANKGCPWSDTDKDGVTDNIDKCVTVPGPASNNGCPVKLTVEAKKKLGTYAKTIQFNSGKATFKPGVTETLDAVAEVMKEFATITFDVEGYTDSVGKASSNKALSQKRAQAVVDYLASHGIDGARLTAVGYGEANPIATNKTKAGRAQNRRVVLTAKEKF